MDIGQPSALSDTLRDLVQEGHDLATILPFFTTNVATVTGLSFKGRIRAQAEADLVVLRDDASVHSVMSRGNWLVRDGDILVPGTFEKLG
jgi:beta-aspartyl-dipeptidase (metallo-type)